MCDVFQLLKYFDNFNNFTPHFIKSFPENINFANTISNCLMPEECTLFQIGKLDSHHSIMGSMIPQTCKLGGVGHCFAWQGTRPCVNCSSSCPNFILTELTL